MLEPRLEDLFVNDAGSLGYGQERQQRRLHVGRESGVRQGMCWRLETGDWKLEKSGGTVFGA